MGPHLFRDTTDTRTDTSGFLRQNTHGYLNNSTGVPPPPAPKHAVAKTRIASIDAGPEWVAELPFGPPKNVTSGGGDSAPRSLESALKIFSSKSLMERVTVARCGCWIWEGARSKEGYGVVRQGDTQRPAQRLFWETFVGPIPEGYIVRTRKLFVCMGKACCNPAHHRLQGPIEESVLRACKQGHLLTPDNVVIENRNGREFKRCRICRREAWKSWQKQRSSPAEGGTKKAN